MTVLESIQKSAEFLAGRDVEPPRLQAELLLAHVLKLPRMQLYLKFDQALSPQQVDQLRELVRRRGRREPLQHIVGSTSFCGFEIGVNRDVLVPRPETELLAEAGWQWLEKEGKSGTKDKTSNIEHRTPNSQAQTSNVEHPTAEDSELRALDFGTGSGCIAIALARHCASARIFAVEQSAQALEIARQNAVRNGAADQIQFVSCNDFSALPGDIQFDLIISNPPYIPSEEIETLQPEVRDFDPREALDGGEDGLRFYRLFASEAATCLKPSGRLMLEFGDGQAEAIRAIFETHNWVVEDIRADYNQRPRILIARPK